jgi:3-oxoisoapionate decarboxylase
MNRRNFLHQASMAALTLPFVKLPASYKAMGMGVVVHSYASRWNSKTESEKYPGFQNAIELIDHCHSIGAGGVQVVVREWGHDFAKKVRDRREKLGLFIEGSISLPKQKDDISRFEKDILDAKEAGAEIVRSVCLNGRRYENFQTLQQFQEFAKNSVTSLQLAEPIVRKHKIKLAIENHKDWRAEELADLLHKLDSEWVGVTLDFGNNIALIDDPMALVNILSPYLFSTHVKDMGLREYEDGFLLSEVPLGEGVLDLKQMFNICRKHRPDVHFNLEMITRDPLHIPCLTKEFWETLPSVPPADLAATLRMVKQHPFKTTLPVVSTLNPEQRLAAEEQNILTCIQYGRTDLGLN